MHPCEKLGGRTLEASVNVTNVPFGEGTQLLREVYEGGTPASVRTAEADHSYLSEPAYVGLEYSVDECSSADADRGDVGW